MESSNKSLFTPKLVSVLLTGYRLAQLRSDVMAGFTVSVVALPLAMALGIASGSTPERGIITAIIAGLLISLFGGSRTQIGGPSGTFVIVVFNVITHFGYEGLILASLMAGVILVIAGYARLGQMIKFIPLPVLSGFTTGIAVIIASTQIREFFGLQLTQIPADFLSKWKAYFSAWHTMSLPTLLFGLAALFAIILIRKFSPRWPGYLIVLIVASFATVLFQLPVETFGTRFPSISSGIHIAHFSSFSFKQLEMLLPSALTIAFLAGIESLLSAVVADGMTGFKHRSNQELVGQGLANIGSALLGGIPATGVLARTVINISAGGRTPMAGIFHSLFLLLFFFCGKHLIQFIPMPALAAILIMVAWGMSDLKRFILIFRTSSIDRLILLLTFLLTIFFDLTIAIGVGVTIASLLFMVRMSQSLEISKNFDHLNDQRTDSDQRIDLPQGAEVFTISGPIFYGVVSELMNTLKRSGYFPKVLIIRMRYVPYLDATGAAALNDLSKTCAANKATVVFSALRPQPAKMLTKFFGHENNGNVKYTHSYDQAVALSKELISPIDSPSLDAPPTHVTF